MPILLPPIILIPGVCGSKLDAINRRTEKIERVWVSKDILPVPQLGKKFVQYLWGRPDPETHLYTSYTNDYAETRTVGGLEGCWRLIDHWFVNILERMFKNASLGKYFVTIIGRLMRDYGYQPNKNLFGFSYDWRQPLYSDCIVGELHRLIIHVRKINNGMPVNIVAHSLGGLVGKTYCQMHSGWATNIRRFITIGTPFDGSSSMTLTSFINGFALNVPGMKLVAARGIQASSSVTLYLSNLPPPPTVAERPKSQNSQVDLNGYIPLTHLSNGLPYSTHYCNSCLYLKKVVKHSKLLSAYPARVKSFFESTSTIAGCPPDAPSDGTPCREITQKPLHSLLFDPPAAARQDVEECFGSSRFDTDAPIPIFKGEQPKGHQRNERVDTRQSSRMHSPRRLSTAGPKLRPHHMRMYSDSIQRNNSVHRELAPKRYSEALKTPFPIHGSKLYPNTVFLECAIYSQEGTAITLRQNTDTPAYRPDRVATISAAPSAGSTRHSMAQRRSRSINLSNIYITLDFSRYHTDVPDIGAILLGKFLSDPTIIADCKKKDVYQLLMKSIESKVIVKTVGIKKPRASGKSLDALLLPNYKSKTSIPAIESIINSKDTWKWEAFSMWSHLGRSNASNVALHPYFRINEAGFPVLKDDCLYKDIIISGILPHGGSFSHNRDLYLIASAQAIYMSTRQLTEPLYRTALIDSEERIVKSKLLNLEYLAPDDMHMVRDTAIYKVDNTGIYLTENKANSKFINARQGKSERIGRGACGSCSSTKVRDFFCRTPVPWAFFFEACEQPLYNLLRQVTTEGTLEAFLFQPFKPYWKTVARNRAKSILYGDLCEDVGSSQLMVRGSSVFPMFSTVIAKDSSSPERFITSNTPSLTPSGSTMRMADSTLDVQEGHMLTTMAADLLNANSPRKHRLHSQLQPERYLKKDEKDPRHIPEELLAEYPILSVMKPCTTDSFRFISINGGNIPTPMHAVYSKPVSTYDELQNQLPVFIMGRGDGTVLLTGALSDDFDDTLVHDRVVVPDVAHFDLMHEQAVFYLIYMGLGLPLSIPSTSQNQGLNEQSDWNKEATGSFDYVSQSSTEKMKQRVRESIKKSKIK